MQFFLSPLISFLSSISYKAKFVLIGLFAMVYTIYSLSHSVIDANHKIAFAKKKFIGAQMIPAVKDLLLETQKLRGTTAAYLSGDITLKSKVDALQKSVQVELEKVDTALISKEVVGLDTLKEEISTKLRTYIPQSLNLSVKEAFTKYSNIIDKEIALIVRIGEQSNLTLNSELDSFYMMDAMVNKLPVIFEGLGKSRGLSASILTRGNITRDELLNLNMLITGVQGEISAIQKGSETIFEENAAIEVLLMDKKELFIRKFQTFLDDVNAHVMKSQTMKSSAIFAEGTEAISAANILFDGVNHALQTILQERVDSYQYDKTVLVLEAALFLLLLAVIFMAFYHSVSGTVNSVVRQLKEIEESKDLTKDLYVESKDELQEITIAYNSLRSSIQTTMQAALNAVESSNSNATQMLSESREIDANSKDMSFTISSMAQKGEEIKEELIASKELAQNSKEQISAAYETLQKATESIQNLASQVEESSHKEMEMADKINQLSQDASDVKNVLSVINDIAEQTNLLALNAAIEAARAGEHGRGFAVVADEVRQLAEKTQKSLSEINATINVIMQNITEASSEMNQNAKDISSMTETSEEVLKEVAWVNTIMNEATKLIEDSSIRIEKNAEGVEKIASDLHEADNISAHNMQKMASISDSSSALAGKVNEIKEKVGAFQL